MPPLAGSPAIDAAVWLATSPATDQQGNPRAQASPDVGAVESGGFSLIPAGVFRMGDAFDEDSLSERPVHEVSVSTFYMARHEVAKAQWDEVRIWGVGHGYTDLPTGGAKAADHPVHSIKWYDLVKWCNARSEKEGLTPCYTVSGAVYRTGNSVPDCNWTANGYRLPTEAEWEKAARGGLSGKRFPWGDTISHSQANYFSTSNLIYDVSQTRGYHPDYNDGVAPYTSPVGSFPPNGFGLQDMMGNVEELCWDRFDFAPYPSATQYDPRGADQGPYRSIRGGCWYYSANGGRVATRYGAYPDGSSNSNGFRVARSVVP
jgi:formylglycine-generating enzyme required for sulfatase activity